VIVHGTIHQSGMVRSITFVKMKVMMMSNNDTMYTIGHSSKWPKHFPMLSIYLESI
jgi:hypothetical protein